MRRFACIVLCATGSVLGQETPKAGKPAQSTENSIPFETTGPRYRTYPFPGPSPTLGFNERNWPLVLNPSKLPEEWFVSHNQPGNEPRIELRELEFDFGKISDQVEISHKFWFENKGAGKLVFKPVQKGTWIEPCYSSDGKRKLEFLGGEQGYLEVKYNAHGKRGDTQQRITLQTNDPAHYPEGPVLFIKAHVVPRITFAPMGVNFGKVQRGKSSTQILHVVGTVTGFKATYVTTSRGRFIKARVIESSPTEIDGEPGGESAIELTLDTTELPLGELGGVGTVRTTDPLMFLCDFPISASVVDEPPAFPLPDPPASSVVVPFKPEARLPRIEFATLEHDFGMVKSNTDPRYRFYFHNTGRAPLNVFETMANSTSEAPPAKSLSGARQAWFEPGEWGFIEVYLHPRNLKGSVERRFFVHTNDPRYK